MNSWVSKNKGFDIDICMYGLYFTPCLFGRNTEHTIEHPGCESHAFTYTALVLTSTLMGVSFAQILHPGSQLLATISGTICSSVIVGSYGGDMRTKLRQKYDISGSPQEDFCAHFFCSPCAVCQEAQEIRYRSKISHENYDAYTPIVQTMNK